MPKVSVIIPVYNAQEYVSRCLDSVCNQTLEDIEIICIDDCSTDASLSILEQYAKDYSNVIVRHLQHNQGESGARNVGLEMALGQYLAFVDNDDEIDLDFCERLYDKAKESDYDIVKGQLIRTQYDGKQDVIEEIVDGSSKFLFLNYWWTAIYKRSLICEYGISFSVEHPLGGDLLFLNEAVIAASDIKVVDDVYYHHHMRRDSGDAQILSAQKVESSLDISEKIIDNINANISGDDVVYSIVFHNFLMSCFYLALKTYDRKIKRKCAVAAINIFGKCKNMSGLHDVLNKNTPHFFELLNSEDPTLLEEVIMKYTSYKDLILGGLRFKLKNKVDDV